MNRRRIENNNSLINNLIAHKRKKKKTDVIKMSRHTTRRLTQDHYKSKYSGIARERRNREVAIQYTFYGQLPYKHGTKRQEDQKYV
jgi:hypothetical protein